MTWLLPLLAAALLLFSAIVAGAETAFLHLSPVDRERLRADPRLEAAQAAALLARSRQLLLTLLICNEAANLGLAATAAAWVIQVAGTSKVGWTPILVVPVLLLLSETIPKSLAARRPLAWVLRLAGPVAVVMTAVLPLRWAVLTLGSLLLRPTGTSPWSLPHQIEEEDLKHLVDLGERAGTIAKDERDMIHSVFAFGDITVARLMTPRTEMVAFQVDTPLEGLLEGIRDQRFARVPIYRSNPDDIIGILYTKDLLTLRLLERLGPRRRTRRALIELLRKAHFVPMTMKADELFREFQVKGVHMAIVVDEYGGVAGLITMDDLMGELFGEMLDEVDAESPATIRIMGDGTWEVSGQVEVLDLNATAGAALTLDDDYSTVGGYVMAHLGRLPEPGEAVEADGWRFEVLDVAESRVVTVRAMPLPPAAEEAEP